MNSLILSLRIHIYFFIFTVLTGGIGGCDARRIVVRGNIPRLYRALYYGLELCALKVRQARNSTGLDVRTGVVIADAAGFNIRQHACLRCKSCFQKWHALV